LAKQLWGVIHRHVETRLLRVCERYPSMSQSLRRAEIVFWTVTDMSVISVKSTAVLTWISKNVGILERKLTIPNSCPVDIGLRVDHGHGF
jgi:hypothetical protein